MMTKLASAPPSLDSDLSGIPSIPSNWKAIIGGDSPENVQFFFLILKQPKNQVEHYLLNIKYIRILPLYRFDFFSLLFDANNKNNIKCSLCDRKVFVF